MVPSSVAKRKIDGHPLNLEFLRPVEDDPGWRTHASAARGWNLYHQALLDSNSAVKG